MRYRAKSLRHIRVRTFKEIEIIRIIYNDNLDMLGTAPLPYRSIEEQKRWWVDNSKSIRAYLYELISKPGEYVGFITLTDRGEFVTPILAVDKKYQGKGFGSEMVRAYFKLAGKPLAGAQLVCNDRIRHMNKKVGWIVVGSAKSINGEIELLYHPGESRINPGTVRIEEIVKEYLRTKYQDI